MARLLALMAAALLARPASSSTGNLTLLTQAAAATGAVCLDGSAPGLYTSYGAELHKVLIFQEGGGWCGPGLNCLQRAATPLGSSTTYPPTMDFSGGYLADDAAENPLMHNWTKVYLKYCDGSSQTSDAAAPAPVGNQTIYYRGHRILLAFQAHLLATALAGAAEVVLAGCSAGGLSTYLHADEWRAALPRATRVTALADSGFFPNFNHTPGGGYGALMRQVAVQMNASLAPACLAANAADPYSCIFAEVAAASLATPTFALQGKYDSWQLKGDVDLPTNDTAGVNAWGALVSARLRASLLAAPQHGAFLDSCLHHCGGFDAFTVDGFTQATAHAAWYAGQARALYNQSEGYPCTACCSGAV